MKDYIWFPREGSVCPEDADCSAIFIIFAVRNTKINEI